MFATWVATSLALCVTEARAEDTSRVAAATLLFDEGIKAMEAGRLAEACPKLVKSQELAPSGGTLLALGTCHERSGRIASAWVAFREAASRAAAAGKVDAEASALEHAAQLEARLPKLTIRVTTRVKDLEVRRDGTLLRPAELDVPTPIDPGRHELRATAPGLEAWSRTIDIGEGSPVVVDVPELTASRRAPAPADPAVQDPPKESAAPAAPSSSGAGQRAVGLIVAAGGLAALGVGGVFGVLAKSSDDDAEAHCKRVDVRRCDPTGLAMIDDAKSQALVSTILVSAGGAALVGGAVLFFTAQRAPQTSLRIVPTFTGSFAGGSATLRW
jgi:hypothetical protein